MARIAIFCDGTWNDAFQAQPTHVHRLFEATAAAVDQRPVYVPGVGTGGKWATRFGNLLNKVGGGAFGWGLNGNIKQAYRALAMLYQPGDGILIFGFSRGAYTARSLAGMIRKVGIIDNPTAARVDEAFEIYRLPGPENHPDRPHIIEKRRALSPRYATSAKEIVWRGSNPLESAEPEPQLIKIDFLGVWDTVGSLGIPTSILGPIAWIWNRKYRFHDTKLSSMVKSARHAVALDERRIFYRPSLWDNLEQGIDDPGLNKGERTDARPYQQIWFVGTHSVVGGSAETRGLTSITLEWMAAGARHAGLRLNDTPPLLDADPNPTADSPELLGAPLIYRLAGSLLDWRKGPGHPVDLHSSAEERIKAREDYRPLSLRALKPELFGGKPHA
ncbi:DUF2235 domain-containing protein [Sulfitobacter sp. MF3-043]|uniref:DUF2235 domain-containing protein n=1 Tax=Sulfitobacter sediminivivens TaxID=3252902 RepID=UPI0036D86A96